MRLDYTDKARTALHMAERAAKRLHQSYVGTEHILLGLIQENTGVAARVLMENGARENDILELIKDFVAPDSKAALAERDGYSPRAVAVLKEAEEIALKYNSDAIGTEHILLGIIRWEKTEDSAWKSLRTRMLKVSPDIPCLSSTAEI